VFSGCSLKLTNNEDCKKGEVRKQEKKRKGAVHKKGEGRRKVKKKKKRGVSLREILKGPVETQ